MTTDAGGGRARVVSLLPAATEIVAALGAVDALVGITHECDYPAAVTSLPRVTASLVDGGAGSAAIDARVRELSAGGVALFSLDADDLTRLAPTHILTQSLCEVCAVSEGYVRAIGELLATPPRILALTGTTLDGVWRDIHAVGALLGCPAAAAHVVSEMKARMDRVHERLAAARAPRPRVAVIEWLEPLYVAGHWTPELVRRAGGTDVLAVPGSHSVQISMEQVRDADPEIVIFAPCGFDVVRAERDARALLASGEWEWARALACWAIDGNALTSRPGPRLADAVEVIAGIVAPESFGAPPARWARRVAAVG